MAEKKQRLRAAIYARFSTDKQDRATSIGAQVENCRAIAARESFVIQDRHVFEDHALSGAKSDRPGYRALKAAIKAKEIDVVLANETSRLTRVTSELLGLCELLQQQRPKMHLVTADGIDTRSDGWEWLALVKAGVDSQERRKIGFRTYGALRQRHQSGKSAGGKAYGYSHEADGKYRVRIIVANEAKVVRRVFKLFADGCSHREIAAELNRDRIPSPGARWNRVDTGQHSKRRDGKWVGSTIYAMLRNPIYRGDDVWNRGEFYLYTDPDTGRTTRKKSRRPESEWMVRHDEALRIIDEALWRRCQSRMKETKERNKQQKHKGGRRRQRLFDLQCTECGGRYTMINGRQLGCASNKNSAGSACSNNARVWIKTANDVLLEELANPEDGLLSDSEIAAVRRDVAKEVQRRKKQASGRAKDVPDEVRALDDRVAKLRKRLSRPDADFEPDELQAAIDRAGQKREELMRLHGRAGAGDLDRLPDIVPDLMRRWREQVTELARPKPALSDHELAQARSLISEILDGPVAVDADLTARFRLHAESMVAGAGNWLYGTRPAALTVQLY